MSKPTTTRALPTMSETEFKQLDALLAEWKAADDVAKGWKERDAEIREDVMGRGLPYITSESKTPFPGVTISEKTDSWDYSQPETLAYFTQPTMLVAASSHGVLTLSRSGFAHLIGLITAQPTLLEQFLAVGGFELDAKTYEATLNKPNLPFPAAPPASKTTKLILSINGKSLKTGDQLRHELNVQPDVTADDEAEPELGAFTALNDIAEKLIKYGEVEPLPSIHIQNSIPTTSGDEAQPTRVNGLAMKEVQRFNVTDKVVIDGKLTGMVMGVSHDGNGGLYYAVACGDTTHAGIRQSSLTSVSELNF